MPTISLPPPGPIHLPSPVTESSFATPPRIRWLDNLRGTLTILLLFHHAVNECSSHTYPLPKSVPLSLFVAVNKTFIWGLFFFISGYSSSLSLSSKSTRDFYISKILRLFLLGLLWGTIGHTMFFLFLGTIHEHIFGSIKANWARIRFSGPTNYVLLLFVFDTLYLLVRWLRRHQQSLAISPQRALVVLAAALVCLTLYTFIIATGVLQVAGQLGDITLYNYDVLHPYIPLQFVIAYVAGLHFSELQTYLVLPRIPAVTTFLASVIATYGSAAVAMTVFPSIREFIILDSPYGIQPIFVDGGFNHHTLFYACWSTFGFFTISMSLVAVYLSLNRMRADWGPWTRLTYFTTFFHMAPLLLTMYWFQDMQLVVLKSVLVGIGAVTGSFGIVLLPWIVRFVLGP